MPRSPAIVKLARLRQGRTAVRGALVLLLALLFQQAALAAYLCPMEQSPAPAPMSMADCHEAPPSTSAPLCSKHCNPDTSTTPDARIAGVAPLLLPPVRFALAERLPARTACAYDSIPLVRSDPPPILRFCSLLI